MLVFAYNKDVWRGGRVVEGARLESVCAGNCTVSSNLILSANSSWNKKRLFEKPFFEFYAIILLHLDGLYSLHRVRLQRVLLYEVHLCMLHQNF
jgi:hypothetical protein